MIARAWYVTCDSCGSPAEVSTESPAEARRLAAREGYRRRNGKDVCRACQDASPREQR